jgi:hypothetical protein
MMVSGRDRIVTLLIVCEWVGSLFRLTRTPSLEPPAEKSSRPDVDPEFVMRLNRATLLPAGNTSHLAEDEPLIRRSSCWRKHQALH